MTDLVHEAHALAWELRAAWINRRPVRISLSDRCIIRTIVGRVSAVSVTDTFVTVDGWHVPVEVIRGIGKPLVQDTEAYAKAMHDLRARSECPFCEGRPVRNARGWVAANEPETLPCPRCGRAS